jgi:hypothetical protein
MVHLSCCSPYVLEFVGCASRRCRCLSCGALGGRCAAVPRRVRNAPRKSSDSSGLTWAPDPVMLGVCLKTPCTRRNRQPPKKHSRRSAADQLWATAGTGWGVEGRGSPSRHAVPAAPRDEASLPTHNAANSTSRLESAVLRTWRAWVPTRAAAASVPGDSGWIPLPNQSGGQVQPFFCWFTLYTHCAA